MGDTSEMILCLRKPTIWVPTRSDTNQAVQSQKMVRGSKFWIKKVEKLHYPCSENKGADQLRGYREADLRLCFRLCRLLVFPCSGSNVLSGFRSVVIGAFINLIRLPDVKAYCN